MSNTNSNEAVRLLARAGYTAKGVVYATVGILAGATTLTVGDGEVGGTRNAIQEIASQPWGSFLLVVLIFGLAGYVIWRFFQGIQDTENKGGGFSGWAQRLGFLMSGTVYLSLLLYALSLASWLPGSPESGGDGTKEDMFGYVMSLEYGGLAIVCLGTALIGVGAYQGYRSGSVNFKESWNIGSVGKSAESILTRVAQGGIAARAITLTVTGWMIAKSGLTFESGAEAGLGESLAVLREQPYGEWILLGVSAGLCLYGAYCFINARYRVIGSGDSSTQAVKV